LSFFSLRRLVEFVSIFNTSSPQLSKHRGTISSDYTRKAHKQTKVVARGAAKVKSDRAKRGEKKKIGLAVPAEALNKIRLASAVGEPLAP
jgi:hypothetical protein